MPWYAYLLRPLFPAQVRARSVAIIDALSRGSTLFRNEGAGRFTDVSDASGLRDAQWSWAAQFVDYDDDGFEDVYVANGFVSGPILDDV
jgi:hypothetical protein